MGSGLRRRAAVRRLKLPLHAAGPLILGGTFDLASREEMNRRLAQRMTGEIGAQLSQADDPHPGRLIRDSLMPLLPQLDYRELANCGHYPWLEKAAAEDFYRLVCVWLDEQMPGPAA